MIRLFIEDKEVELNENVQVAITKQFEDLSNPTTIINDWSKTVSIPFTQNNHKLFGHIYNPDKIVITNRSSNLISSPSRIRKWNGSTYVDDSLVGGELVCDLNTQYIQLGFQKADWKYTATKNYSCNNDTHTYEFIYDSVKDYRLEFSFRDLSSEASNNEVYFAQWDLNGIGLIEGETYVVSFSHRKSGNNYIIYDWALTKRPSFTGLYFDPYKKLNFRLQWNDDVLMTGYAKMNEIKQTAGKGTYDITLFGQLGKVLQELQKITFDSTLNDTTYLIHGEDYVDDVINASLVYNSWTSSGQTQEEVKKIGESGYKVTDIIGFAPNNAYTEGFNYDTYQQSSTTSGLFTDVLGDNFTNVTGIDPSTVIPNGVKPREIGEYRSYLQLPYIYFNKLFQIFQEKAESVTGYKFELNPLWFSKKNPYWYNLVYMLKGFSPKNGNTFNNSYGENGATILSSFTYNAQSNSMYNPNIIGDTWHDGGFINLRVSSESLPVMSDNTIHIQKGSSIRFTTVPVQFSFTNSRDTIPNNVHFQYFRLNNGHYPSYELSLYDSNDNLISGSVKKFGVTYSGNDESRVQSDKATLGLDEIVYTPASVYCGWQSTYTFNLALPYNKTFTFNDSGTYKLRIKFKWSNISNTNHIPFSSYDPSGDPNFNLAAYCAPLVLKTSSSAAIPIEITRGVLRTGINFILNDLWNNDYPVFNEILKYCKMYRIGIKVDDVNKKIIFNPISNYFTNYTVKDWTNKIDKSKDFRINPITLENKYLHFNYEDNKTKLGEDYKKNFGVNYGDYKLSTEYNFNNETKKLFEKVNTSIINTDNILSWNNLVNNRIVYSFPSEKYIYNRDKEDKQVDVFGSYFFHNGITSFSTEASLHLRAVVLTDDTDFQKNNNTYFYSQNVGTRIQVYSYPLLDVVKGDNMCLFNVPSENYTYVNNYNGKKSIYANLWNAYLNERYNLQNKKITCYVDIKPTEFSTFDWNNLVKVGNQLCIVNKIYDYDVTSSQPTKVDLITIQNIEGYTNIDFFYDLDTIDLDWTGTLYISGEAGMSGNLGHVSSSSKVTFSNNTTTYTVGGVKFTIVDNNTVHYETVFKYLDKEDLDMDITLKNETGHTASFHIVRYATYPYPWIIIEDSEGNEVSTLPTGSFGGYKLKWHGTDTEGLENKPTVTVSIIPLMAGTGVTIDNTSWTEDIVMIQEGDDEWFKTEYSVNLSYTLRTQQKVQITVVDKEGWHETRTYTVQ